MTEQILVEISFVIRIKKTGLQNIWMTIYLPYTYDWPSALQFRMSVLYYAP